MRNTVGIYGRSPTGSPLRTVALLAIMSSVTIAAGCDGLLCNLPFVNLFLPACRDQGCNANADCAGDANGEVCQASTGDCVECLLDDDCDQGFCSESLGNVCVDCLLDENCDDGEDCTLDGCDGGECVNVDIECEEGESCVDGECVPDEPEDPCEGVTCDEGQICVDGACELEDTSCDGIVCSDGETCIDGECVLDDPCAGIVCGQGESCVDGDCVLDDPCVGIVCDDGLMCVDGECVSDDPCAGIVCGGGETCVDGECVLDDPCAGFVGNATTGEMFYNDNGCAACHGASGEGSIGPSLIGVPCSTILANLNGTDSHPVTVESVTAQDAADLKAWLDSL